MSSSESPRNSATAKKERKMAIDQLQVESDLLFKVYSTKVNKTNTDLDSDLMNVVNDILKTSNYLNPRGVPGPEIKHNKEIHRKLEKLKELMGKFRQAMIDCGHLSLEDEVKNLQAQSDFLFKVYKEKVTGEEDTTEEIEEAKNAIFKKFPYRDSCLWIGPEISINFNKSRNLCQPKMEETKELLEKFRQAMLEHGHLLEEDTVKTHYVSE